MTTLQPLFDKIVVQLIKAEAITAGGIVIPDAATEKPSQGIVTAVGPGRHDDKGNFIQVTVKVGDRVLFSKTAGQVLKLDDEDVHVFNEDQIIAIVNPK